MSTRIIFGVHLTRTKHDGQFAGRLRDVEIYLLGVDGTSRVSLDVILSRGRGGPHIKIGVYGPIETIETQWLEVASLETPRLCALVLDLSTKDAA